MRVFPPIAAAAAALVAISMPAGLDSCAIGPPLSLFAPATRPASLATFLSGRVGVLRRTYHQRYLIAGFRILSGKPLSEAESASLVPPPQLTGYTSTDSSALNLWLSSRKAVRGVNPDVRVERYKRAPGKEDYQTFRNCQDPAFETAVDTLQELRAQWPDDDPRLVDWVRAQDQVFENCSGEAGGPVIPAETPANADPLLAKHRRYQIAAARMYAGQHRQASDAFRQIAADAESPWHSLCPYLSARALLRAGSLEGDMAAFQDGKRELLAILNDPAQAEWHEASLDLLHLWQLRAEPYKRMEELSEELMQPTDDDKTQSVIDFLHLMGLADGDRKAAAGELPAWLVAMSERPPTSAGSMSIDRWRKTQNPAWLVAALANAPEAELAPLLDAARKVPPAWPAYESVVYYAVAREVARGNRNGARLLADGALRKNLLRSTRNLILGERIRVAADWVEFLRFSLRRTEPTIEYYDYAEVEVENPRTDNPPVFAWDVVTAFNNALPLSLWEDASRNPALPKAMQLRIAEAGWTRAVVLEDFDRAKRLMQRVVELAPNAVGASAFLQAANPEDARRSALYIILRASTLRPRLPGPDDSTPNLSAAGNFTVSCWAGRVEEESVRAWDFLSEEQRATAGAEVKKLDAAEPRDASFLLRSTLEWAQSKPDDPRVPEALHRAVMAARYRCGDQANRKLSQQTYALLHRRYPKSPWAAKTKYWY